jgi:hypothetical protein
LRRGHRDLAIEHRAAVWAKAGRTVTTVDAATAPSASTVRRVGMRSIPPALAGGSWLPSPLMTEVMIQPFQTSAKRYPADLY